jgi:uncharacterized membrane protein HdeD (DUF308 family)
MDAVNKRIADTLCQHWGIVLVRGIAAIAFGLLTWIRPDITLATLVLFFGAYALLDGILETVTAIRGRHDEEHWWLLLLAGLVGVGVGVLTFMTPAITAIALLFYIAVWAIARGVLEIAVAIRVRKEMDGEWRLILAGLASVAFGVLLMVRPGAGALTVLWLIGAYALGFGILLVMLAFKVKGLEQRLSHARTA